MPDRFPPFRTVLFPYSYSCDVVTRDQENHYEAVLQAAKALRDVHGRVFETGSVCEVSLTSPGESLDWACESPALPALERVSTLSRDRVTDSCVFAYCVDAVAKIRWSFATELRDGGIFGTWATPLPCFPFQCFSADRKS